MARHGENIRKRSDGRWEARYIERYESGHAKYRYVYGHSYAEVKRKRNFMIKESTPRVRLPKAAETLESLIKVWLDNIKISVKESTLERYRGNMNRYIIPKLGKIQLYKLDAFTINSLSDELMQKGISNRPLSAKTVSDTLVMLKSCLKFGAENGYPSPNLSAIRLPKVEKSEINTLTSFDRSRIWEVLRNADDRFSICVLLALCTGMRIGEICALRHYDLDLEAGKISIHATVQRVNNPNAEIFDKTKVIISSGKTENSSRVIPLPSLVLTKLLQLKEAEESFVLTGTSKPCEPHTFYVRYKRFLKRIGLPNYTFHALRHTFATAFIEHNFDTKALSEILGHANVATTLRYYVHPSFEAKRTQMEQLWET